MSNASEPPIPDHAPDAGTVDRVKDGTKLIRIAAAWLLLLMLAMAASMVTISIVNSRDFGPEKTVANYLAALEAGDGAKALGLLQAKVPTADASALDGEALAKSQAALKNVTIGEAVSAPDNQKIVTVNYTAGNTPFKSDFTLIQGPKHWLFFDSWTMIPSTLPTINVSVVNANQASINGAVANMPGGRNSFAVFYPGSYELEYRSALFAAAPVTRVVSGSGSAISAVGLSTGPTSDLLAQVGGTIGKYLDACAKQAVLMPTGCPLNEVSNNRVVSAVDWTILEYPLITISPYGGQWILAPLSVKAQVEYKEQDLFSGLVFPVKRVDDFAFTAKLSITDTTVVVTPQLSF